MMFPEPRRIDDFSIRSFKLLYLIISIGHQTSAPTLNNSIFGNALFPSISQIPSSSTTANQKFSAPQQQQMFSSQPFPSQFPSTSNPFVQQSFGTSIIN